MPCHPGRAGAGGAHGAGAELQGGRMAAPTVGPAARGASGWRPDPAGSPAGGGPGVAEDERRAGSVSRQACEAMDREDGLRGVRERFQLPAGLIYMDGNSLGPLPKATPARLAEVGPRPCLGC